MSAPIDPRTALLEMLEDIERHNMSASYVTPPHLIDGWRRSLDAGSSEADRLRSALRAAVLGWEIAVEALAVETGRPALPETRARIDACRELLGDER